MKILTPFIFYQNNSPDTFGLGIGYYLPYACSVYSDGDVGSNSADDNSYGRMILSRKNLKFRSPSFLNNDYACCVMDDGVTDSYRWIVTNSYGRSSPNLGYDTGMWNINAGGNTDHYYGAGFSSCGRKFLSGIK